ncbi:MAG TPA: tRNA epoxyqueuosine(34) reductase QueG, partial [Bacteroidales bacterium]|nr:tRNA epoxyqueuosine(34) reductase QueG [Bacteroidales bacterium]
EIKQRSLELGFTFCGIAPARPLEELRDYYSRFLGVHPYPGLEYLEKYAGPRLDPSLLLPEIRSVIAVLLNYYPREVIPAENNFFVSKYAYGKDHHPVMKARLQDLTRFIAGLSPGIRTLAFVDSGPVLEKAWAQRCGVGWQGKNTLLLNKERGSFFFIGILLTSLETEYDLPAEDHCGTCTRCMEACPTGAITAPYELDPLRCIAYHTIETEPGIPEEIAHKMGDRIYGCDTCQDVCPFNKSALPHDEPAFFPSEEFRRLRKPDWKELTEDDFERIFKGMAMKRTGYRKIMDTIRRAT